MRFGIGYDTHRFTNGDHVMIGGVRIPHSKGIEAHSDGDVLIHAIIDAILGACGLGDIGTHYPDNDDLFKNADSRHLLKKTNWPRVPKKTHINSLKFKLFNPSRSSKSRQLGHDGKSWNSGDCQLG